MQQPSALQGGMRPIHDRFSAEYDPAIVKVFRAEIERINGL